MDFKDKMRQTLNLSWMYWQKKTKIIEFHGSCKFLKIALKQSHTIKYYGQKRKIR